MGKQPNLHNNKKLWGENSGSRNESFQPVQDSSMLGARSFRTIFLRVLKNNKIKEKRVSCKLLLLLYRHFLALSSPSSVRMLCKRGRTGRPTFPRYKCFHASSKRRLSASFHFFFDTLASAKQNSPHRKNKNGEKRRERDAQSHLKNDGQYFSPRLYVKSCCSLPK